MMTRKSRPVIALTPGDCTGIGPELIAKVLCERRMDDVARLIAFGDSRVFRLGMRQAGAFFRFQQISTPAEADWSSSEIPLIDLNNIDPAQFPPGEVSAESGRLTGDTLAQAIQFAKAGQLD